MKYGIQYHAGEYVYRGQQVAVVRFDTGSDLREWVTQGQSRKIIPAKQYVQDSSGNNVSMRSAAVVPESLAVLAQRRVRLSLEAEVHHETLQR